MDQPLDDYPFLKAALEDMQLVSQLTRNRLGTTRHIVYLLHDAIEFILYESLLALDQDIYRDGQNTIGLNAALALCKAKGIELPLPGTIRTIQKHRGDAKHHAQVPHDAAFARMVGAFRVVASRLVHERFGAVLGSELRKLGLLPYHLALYESYRKYRTHNWDQAARFALGALLHKHRAVMGIADDYSAGTMHDPAAILRIFSKEVAEASYPPAPPEALKYLTELPDQLSKSLTEGRISDAAEIAGGGFSKVENILPGVFNAKGARRITDLLVQPEHFIIDRAMSWSKWHGTDTERKRQIEEKLRELLQRRPDLVKEFGKPYYEAEEDNYWRWWEFAVFDGNKWHTFHMAPDFSLSLESGGLSDDDGKRREQVAELILVQFERAAEERKI